MSGIVFQLDTISKGFLSREGTRILALDSVSFEARKGDITCLVGPTASGKSTILRLLSGLDRADSGRVVIDGSTNRPQPGTIGYLTQRHTLLPWMTVRENIGLPLELRGMASADSSKRVTDIADALALTNALKLYPYELSGGMQQRAALGRLLGSGSPYWFMDEPFTNLDERTQHGLQRLLLDLRDEHGLSVLFVTHSIDEAVFLADRIVVLTASPGKVLNVIDPEIPQPRKRLSPEYGTLMERIRQSIESVLE